MTTQPTSAGHGRNLQFLTVKDLELLLKIDAKTIYRYVRKGWIPYIRVQSNIRFDYDEVLEWIEARHFRPRPTPVRAAFGR